MAIAAWRKGIAEFIGAFTLIFIGAGAILTAGSTSTSDLLLVALAHGLAIGVMVSALAHVSGGHFNPAVTFGALVSRQISPRLAVVYWVAQLLGGLGGALALAGVFPASIWQPYHLGTPTLGSTVSGLGWDVGIGTGILVEAILTFLLVFVIFGTGIDPKGSFNAVGGLAIGLTISIDIMMGGPLTGAAMNPARWFGPAVVSGFFDNWYVYWIGPFIGGAFAALLYANVFLEKPR
ncbi:MAG: aquaporin [Methanobacteriota archaeon]|nr:MAG: aquaporin [Euryarchaeota archaeon]